MTDEQRERLDRSRRALGPCIEDRVAMLSDFLSQLELPEPEAFGKDAARFLPAISEWLDAQTIRPEDFGFLVVRLAVLVGEIVVQRFGGRWFLDDNPISPSFASYVVGRFSPLLKPDA